MHVPSLIHFSQTTSAPLLINWFWVCAASHPSFAWSVNVEWSGIPIFEKLIERCQLSSYGSRGGTIRRHRGYDDCWCGWIMMLVRSPGPLGLIWSSGSIFSIPCPLGCRDHYLQTHEHCPYVAMGLEDSALGRGSLVAAYPCQIPTGLPFGRLWPAGWHKVLAGDPINQTRDLCQMSYQD